MEPLNAPLQLTPLGPPGRRTRKARAYHAEIHRLRAEGYTFDAIRQALLGAGVEVSVATVKREADKKSPPVPAQPSQAVNAVSARDSIRAQSSMHNVSSRPADSNSATDALRSFVGDARTGKQIVEEFMRGRTTNPLLQERSHHEDRRD